MRTCASIVSVVDDSELSDTTGDLSIRVVRGYPLYASIYAPKQGSLWPAWPIRASTALVVVEERIEQLDVTMQS